MLVVPEDPGVWTQVSVSWASFRDVFNQAVLPLADPLQVLFDVSRSSSADADQAVDHLRRHVVQKLSARRPEILETNERTPI